MSETENKVEDKPIENTEQQSEYIIEKKPLKTIHVDFWKTGLHKKKVGFKKDLEFKAKSIHFTDDMDIIGSIKEDKKAIGDVAFRKGMEDKRMVIKLFTDDTEWFASVEELVAHSVIQSQIREKRFASFVIIIKDYKYLLRLEKRDGGFGTKEKYAFGFYDAENNLQSFKIEQKRLSIGNDWSVKNIKGETVATLDGKKFDFGGKSIIRIFHNQLSKDQNFYISLMLFVSMLKFEGKVEKRIGTLIKDSKKGKKVEIDPDELKLYEDRVTAHYMRIE